VAARGSFDLSAADLSFVGEDGDLSGSSVSSAGDVDGDGFDDLLVGARGVDAGDLLSVGAVYLVLGSGF